MRSKRPIAIAVAITAISALAAAAPAHDAGQPASGHHGDGVQDEHGQRTTARPGTRVSIRVVKDRFKGWNLLIRTKRFRFAPEHASQRHRLGEGHAHLDIDGKPVTRIYGHGYFISELSPGRHKIRVALATNSHAEYVNSKGRPLADTTTVTVREGQR